MSVKDSKFMSMFLDMFIKILEQALKAGFIELATAIYHLSTTMQKETEEGGSLQRVNFATKAKISNLVMKSKAISNC